MRQLAGTMRFVWRALSETSDSSLHQVNSMTIVTLPPYQTMMNPIIHVLKMLGSSATIEELNSEVIFRGAMVGRTKPWSHDEGH